MEIVKTLVLTTAHVTEETAQWLDSDPDQLVVYNKESGEDQYGWFIPVYMAQEVLEEAIPEELKEIIQFADAHKCTWIMFDRDADEIDELPVFER